MADDQIGRSNALFGVRSGRHRNIESARDTYATCASRGIRPASETDRDRFRSVLGAVLASNLRTVVHRGIPPGVGTRRV